MFHYKIYLPANAYLNSPLGAVIRRNISEYIMDAFLPFIYFVEKLIKSWRWNFRPVKMEKLFCNGNMHTRVKKHWNKDKFANCTKLTISSRFKKHARQAKTFTRFLVLLHVVISFNVITFRPTVTDIIPKFQFLTAVIITLFILNFFSLT